MLKEIGERVRKARMERNMTQAQLAKDLRVSAPFISNIEQGKQSMSVTTLSGICEVLQVSADWVLCNASPQAGRIMDQEIAGLLQDCTPAEKNAMIKLLYSLKEVLRSRHG